MPGPTPEQVEELVAAAKAVQGNAYVPASGFHVGAAVLAEDGRVFAGCNVENASYGLTLCAERVAASTAVAAGARRLLAVAVIADQVEPVRPCGACRQFLAEFGADMAVVLLGSEGSRKQTDLRVLLPQPFTFRGASE